MLRIHLPAGRYPATTGGQSMSQVELKGIEKYRAVIAERNARKQELVERQIAKTAARKARDAKKRKKAKQNGSLPPEIRQAKHEKMLASHARQKEAQSEREGLKCRPLEQHIGGTPPVCCPVFYK